MNLQASADSSYSVTDLTSHPLFTVLVGVLSFVAGLLIQLYRDRYQTKNQLRMTAMEKRLQAHQEAYALASEMKDYVMWFEDEDKLADTVRKAMDWWRGNCFYLDPLPREEFASIIFEVDMNITVNIKITYEMIGQRLNSVRKSLEAAVGLPPFSDVERAKQRDVA